MVRIDRGRTAARFGEARFGDVDDEMLNALISDSESSDSEDEARREREADDREQFDQWWRAGELDDDAPLVQDERPLGDVAEDLDFAVYVSNVN